MAESSYGKKKDEQDEIYEVFYRFLLGFSKDLKMEMELSSRDKNGFVFKFKISEEYSQSVGLILGEEMLLLMGTQINPDFHPDSDGFDPGKSEFGFSKPVKLERVSNESQFERILQRQEGMIKEFLLKGAFHGEALKEAIIKKQDSRNKEAKDIKKKKKQN